MDKKTEKFRKKYLMGICSAQLVSMILYHSGTSDAENVKHLEKAKKIAKSKGRDRVYLEDWEKSK